MGNGSDRRIAICVITFRRPDGLRRLLAALGRLEFPGTHPPIEVVVIDNDAAGSAGDVCAVVAPSYRWPLRYEVEPTPGIPAARNRAVACALDRTDFLAFVDDDASPHPTWMAELLEVHRAHAADVVTGPQIRRFPSDAPAWVRRGRWFEPRRYVTGHRLTQAFTGNVLIRGQVFRGMDLWFDERIGLGGGSDVEFFRRVHLAGHTIVWADRAVVEEWMPASRISVKWVLLRAYSQGNAATLLEIKLGHPLRSRLTAVGRAALLATRGLVLLPMRLALGQRGLIQSLWYVCRAAGMLSGLAGYRFAYYRDGVHADP